MLNKPIFLVNCIVVFFALTSPASSMQKPQAMNITRNPDIKNSNEFKMKTLCGGASWAKAGLAGEWILFTIDALVLTSLVCTIGRNDFKKVFYFSYTIMAFRKIVNGYLKG